MKYLPKATVTLVRSENQAQIQDKVVNCLSRLFILYQTTRPDFTREVTGSHESQSCILKLDALAIITGSYFKQMGNRTRIT